MQFLNIFVSLLLTTAVTAKGASKDNAKSDAKGNSTTKAVTEKSQCAMMAEYSSLVALAANTTKLDEKTKSNATKVAEIQSKASAASAALPSLMANTTLVANCAVRSAAEKTAGTCAEMKSLQKLIDLAGNSTELATKTKNNETKAALIQAEASKASTKMATLSSNSTLTSACTTIDTEEAAKKDSKDNGTTKAEASASAAAASASSTSSSTSAANGFAAVSGVLSTIAIVAAGMLALA